MTNFKTTMKGIIHGRTIELDEEPGLPDGSAISVNVTPLPEKDTQAKLEAFQNAAGGWSDDPAGLDLFLEETRQQRKTVRGENAE